MAANSPDNDSNGQVSVRDGLLVTGAGEPSKAEGQGESMSLGLPLLVAAVNRRKLWVMAAIALGLLAGLVIFMLSPPVYSAEARLEVVPENAEAVEVDQSSSSGPTIDEAYMLTQEELLQTRSMRERVARAARLDLEEEIVSQSLGPDQRMQGAVGWVAANTNVQQISGTRIFAIRVESPSRNLSARVANAYAEAFINANIEKQIEGSAYARSYLTEQLKDTREALEDSERQLAAFAQDQQIFQLSEGENGAGGRSLDNVTLEQINAALAAARAKRIAAEQRLRAGATGIQPTQRTAQAPDRQVAIELARLQAEYQQKLEIFKPDYPEMVELQRRIDSLRNASNQIGRDQAQAENAARAATQGEMRQQLQAEFRAARGEEQQLQGQLNQLVSAVNSERSENVQYNILQREVATNAANYDALLQRLKEVGLAGGNVENLISIVDPATPPGSPVRPNLPVNLAIGGFGGLIAGLLFAIAPEVFTAVIRRPDDLPNLLGLKLIGAVPFIDSDDAVVDELADPKSWLFESFLSIFNQLRFATASGFPKTLLLSSTEPGEGKSTVSFGIAKIAARRDKRVLLIDADLRRPTFTSEDHVSLEDAAHVDHGPKNRGIVNVLVDNLQVDDVLRKIDDNLWLLASGDTPLNPAELLSSERFGALFAELRDRFDYVILDGPPVIGLADSPILSALADATLFVVRAEGPRIGQARVAVQRLRDSDAKIVGGILSQSKSDKHDDYGYGYGYGYGAAKRGKDSVISVRER